MPVSGKTGLITNMTGVSSTRSAGRTTPVGYGTAGPGPAKKSGPGPFTGCEPECTLRRLLNAASPQFSHPPIFFPRERTSCPEVAGRRPHEQGHTL